MRSYAPLVSSPLAWFTRQSRSQPRLQPPPKVSRKPIRAIYRRVSFDLGPPPPSTTVSRTHSFRVDLEGIFLLKSLRRIPLPSRDFVRYLRAMSTPAPRALKRGRSHNEVDGERPAKRRRAYPRNVRVLAFLLNKFLNAMLCMTRDPDTKDSDLIPVRHLIPTIPVSDKVK